MKYTININQKQAIELGLTNINQLFIFDLLTSAQSWAKTIIIEGETHYWVARQAIAEQLPILNLKSDTVYRHLKELSKLGLISYMKNGNMDCINITEKGKSYMFGSKSEDSEVDHEQLGSRPQDDSEAVPTYKATTSISLLNNKSLEFEDFWKQYPRKESKAQAKTAWGKMSEVNKLLAIDNITKFVDSVSNEKYIPHGVRYQTHKRWQDVEGQVEYEEDWADGRRPSEVAMERKQVNGILIDGGLYS